MARLAWLLLLVGVLALFNPVMAQDADEAAKADTDVIDEDYEEEFEDVSGGHSQDVLTNHLFAGFPDKRLHLGKDITLLLGFANTGDREFNITNVKGYLHSPFDFNYYIQNFTTKSVGARVPPNSQVSIEYTFKPDATLEPLEFWFSAFVEYNTSDNSHFYRTTFTNGTVELIEPPRDVDVKQVFSYFLVCAGMGLLAYIVYNTSLKGKGSKRRGAAAPSSSGGDDWGEIEVYKADAKSRKASSRRKKAPKKTD